MSEEMNPWNSHGQSTLASIVHVLVYTGHDVYWSLHRALKANEKIEKQCMKPFTLAFLLLLICSTTGFWLQVW